MRYILFCLVLIVGTQARSIDVNSFETFSEESQYIYLTGVIEGILFSQVANTVNNSDPFICSPDTVKYTAELARAAIATNNDPTSRVGLAVVLGLQKMFPCE